MVYLMVACLIVSFVALHLIYFRLLLPDQERHLPSALRTQGLLVLLLFSIGF